MRFWSAEDQRILVALARRTTTRPIRWAAQRRLFHCRSFLIESSPPASKCWPSNRSITCDISLQLFGIGACKDESVQEIDFESVCQTSIAHVVRILLILNQSPLARCSGASVSSKSAGESSPGRRSVAASATAGRFAATNR